MGNQSSMLRNKPDLKNAAITMVEAVSFGGMIIATDFLDEKFGMDQNTLKSLSNAVPIALSIASTAGMIMTKGQTQAVMRDVQLMSTPFALISVTRVLRAKGVFGRFFKKKASINHSRSFEHQRTGGRTPAIYSSEMSFSGYDGQ